MAREKEGYRENIEQLNRLYSQPLRSIGITRR